MLLATSNFMIINNSFSVKLRPPKMHEIASLATFNFKIFRGSISPGLPPDWLAPSGESGLTLIYAACYAVLDACGTLIRCRERHPSRDCTVAVSLNRDFKVDFQSLLRTLETLFTTFVLFHVRRHKM